MHGELGVVAVGLDQLGPRHPLLAALAEQSFPLRLQVAEEAAPASRLANMSASARRRSPQTVECSGFTKRRIWTVGLPLAAEPGVLAQAVDDQVEVAGPRARRAPAAPLVGGGVVAGALLGGAVDVMLERDEADQAGRRLDGDAHFVPIVRAAQV